MKRLLTVFLSLSLCCSLALAQKSSSSRPSSSSSSSRPSSSSSSSRPSSSSSSRPSTSSSRPSSSSPSKSYSAPSSKPSTSATKPSTSSSRPTSTSYDKSAQRATQKEESRKAFQAAKKGDAPKTEYKAADGRTVKIDPKDKKIERLRTQLNQEKFENRQLRQENFYANYYSRPPLFSPTVVYHDSFNPWFFMWLMDRSLDDRAMWMYHHRSEMDDSRYQALLAKDAQLEARLKQLERDKVQRDNGYVLSGVDPDLQYSDEYVHAVYNPQHETPVVVVGAAPVISGGISWGWFWFFIIFGIGAAAIAIWLVFFREIR